MYIDYNGHEPIEYQLSIQGMNINSNNGSDYDIAAKEWSKIKAAYNEYDTQIKIAAAGVIVAGALTYTTLADGGKNLKTIAGAAGASGGIIEKVADGAFKVNKIFSQKHVNAGIMNLGKNQGEIISKLQEVITKVDKAGKLTAEGNWRIQTIINDVKTEISVYVENGTLKNVDAWVGWSERQLEKVIKMLE